MPSPVDEVLPPPSTLAGDANGDGRLTFGDVPHWLTHLFFLPGDWAVWAIARYTPFAAFAGGDSPSYGGFASGFIALVFWFLVLALLGAGYSYVVDFDRRATRVSARVYDEMRRLLRVASRLLRAGWHRRAARVESSSLEFATDIELGALETQVLRELVELAPGYAAAAGELARALRLRTDEVRVPLEVLVERRLAIRTLGGAEGESGYAVSVAGRAALVMRQLAPRSSDF